MTDVNVDPELSRLWRLRFRAQDLVTAAQRLVEDLREEENKARANDAAEQLSIVESGLVKLLGKRDA